MENKIKIKIDFQKISKNFAIENFELDIKENNINTIIGKNGSGKSSILKMITKEVPIKNNSIFFGDKDINNISYKELSLLISYMPQMINIHGELLVNDYLELSRSMYANFFGILSKKDMDIIDTICKELEIVNLRNKKFLELSGGERQKILLASCLIQDTPIIILDEPLTYLDTNNQIEFIKIIKLAKEKYKKTIIMVLHEIEIAFNIADNISLMSNGKLIISDVPNKVLTNQIMKDFLLIDGEFKKIKNQWKLVINN